MTRATVIADGLYFGEGPRWHDGRLWFTDFYDHAVKSMDSSGNVRTELEIDDQPSGLGWLPDGRLLVVSMHRRQVLRVDADGIKVHADLSVLATFHCNDMVVDRLGRAYVGNFGFDLDQALHARGVEGVLADHATAVLARVDPDGSVHTASTEMHFPNGSVITPDGICRDRNGHVWIANAIGPECVLFAPGGEIVATFATEQPCFACALGGSDGRTLYMLTAPSSLGDIARASRRDRVLCANVATAGEASA